MRALYAIPAWLGMCFIVAGIAGLAVGGHVLVHRAFRRVDFSEHNEVAGFTIAVVGVLYAVLLAFLTVVVWERFAQAEDRAHEEVDAAADVVRFSEYLPASQARRIRTDLERYTVVEVDDEWPAMRHGGSSERAEALMLSLIGDVAQLDAATPQRSNLQLHLLDRVQVMADLRRRRVAENSSGVPTVMWLGLAIGAFCVIGFLYLFGLRRFGVQLLMTGAAAAVIGIAFGLIIELDYPFRGEVSVSADRWVALHHKLVSEKH